MPVVAVFEGVTREQYEEAILKLTGGKPQLESIADWPVGGVLMHVTGDSSQGFRAVDVWESEEALGRFGEILAPILQEIGAETQMDVYPVHTFVSA